MEKPIVAGNPQASLCGLSWLGGIIDGEGCITVDKRSSKVRSQQGVTPTITIVNTDGVLMSKVEEILKENGLAYYVRHHPATKRWRPKIEIIIAGVKRVTRFLTVLRPFMVSKARKAELLAALCDSRAGKRGIYSDKEKSICREIWKLNGRGTDHWLHTKASTTTSPASLGDEDRV